ncbi:RNA polymerase sigma factor [Streptomyces liliifuscus]|uniref:RNA polymerase sigma factor n=1 Tax=Streptomyces liliifuscus TaxID=2797636 RepID=A0A7T7L4N2_9ACTN|nr:RNA polymerase sigma factor [Streptomyces liliifuscus]QQM46370.1 RNA polymerase sigma factor [Streptomyces liliifuscus]
MTHEEFEAFFRKDYPNLIRHLTIQGFPRDLVTDVAQEAMLRLFRTQGGVSQPQRWVRVTARHIALDACRRDAQRERLSQQAAEQPTPGPAQPDTAVAERNQAAMVLRLLLELPPRQQEVMAWHLDGYRPEEIAEILGSKRATVDSNLRHARDKLRKAWNDDERGEAE